MPPQVISLNLLRTLECVARHMSFARAAAELCVSASAVSQQVQKLEEQLGVEFFRRVSNKLIQTEVCVACLEPLQGGLGQLAQVSSIVETFRRGGRLRLSVAPSFAARWLVPRLGRFRDRHPDIDVWVNVSVDLVDFSKGEVDAAIRYGRGRYPNLNTQLLANESVVPVCNPALLDLPSDLQVSDFLKFTLLHDDSAEADDRCPNWQAWLADRGVRVPHDGGLHFNQSNLVLEAAVAGRGIALAKRTLARPDIAAGRLVELHQSVPVECAYYFVCPSAHSALAPVAALRTWLTEELAEARGEHPLLGPGAINEAVRIGDSAPGSRPVGH